MLVKSKDDVINKLVLNKKETDGTSAVLQSEANKQRDEAKRLLNELNACIKQLKESETAVRILSFCFELLFKSRYIMCCLLIICELM